VTGINLAVPYRRNLVSGDTDIAFQMQPGISIYDNDGVLFGIGGPVGVVAGSTSARRSRWTSAWTSRCSSPSPIPPASCSGRSSAAGEYLIDRNLAVTARFRVGPQFGLTSSGTATQTGFVTLIGLAYNAR